MRIAKKGKQARYKARLLELYRQGKLPTGPGLYHADVYHDDDCAHWRGGACDCEPDVKIRPDRRRMRRDD